MQFFKRIRHHFVKRWDRYTKRLNPLKTWGDGVNPGGDPGANLKSISHRCYPILVAFAWESTKKFYLPLCFFPAWCVHRHCCTGRNRHRSHKSLYKAMEPSQEKGRWCACTVIVVLAEIGAVLRCPRVCSRRFTNTYTQRWHSHKKRGDGGCVPSLLYWPKSAPFSGAHGCVRDPHVGWSLFPIMHQ